MKKLVVISFGTKYRETREKTIGAIETAIGKAFPDYEVSRAFTSARVVKLIEEAEGIQIPTFAQWMEKEIEGIEELLIVPTHFMGGREYQKILNLVTEKMESGDLAGVKVCIAEPLISSEKDMKAVLAALGCGERQNPPITLDNGEKQNPSAYCLMGHGTDAASNQVYGRMQELLVEMGETDTYIGTVEAEPSIQTICQKLRGRSYDKVVLQPMMVVAGDHAIHDMAGENDDSWKTILEREGYEVECILKGLGEIPEIQKLYIRHAQDAKEIQNEK